MLQVPHLQTNDPVRGEARPQRPFDHLDPFVGQRDEALRQVLRFEHRDDADADGDLRGAGGIGDHTLTDRVPEYEADQDTGRKDDHQRQDRERGDQAPGSAGSVGSGRPTPGGRLDRHRGSSAVRTINSSAATTPVDPFGRFEREPPGYLGLGGMSNGTVQRNREGVARQAGVGLGAAPTPSVSPTGAATPSLTTRARTSP